MSSSCSSCSRCLPGQANRAVVVAVSQVVAKVVAVVVEVPRCAYFSHHIGLYSISFRVCGRVKIYRNQTTCDIIAFAAGLRYNVIKHIKLCFIFFFIYATFQVVIEKHRHEGVFVAKGKEDALVTRNLVPGESVYGEKRISVEQVHIFAVSYRQRLIRFASLTSFIRAQEDGTKVEYRVWNPFRSKLAAAIMGGVENIWIKPGAKVRNIHSPSTLRTYFGE